MLVAGFLENSLGEIYSEYARRGANESVAKYASSAILRIQNPRAQRFVETANAFNSEWGNALEIFLKTGGRKDAVDAIINNRNLITHGRDVGITVVSVKQYLEKCVEVIKFLEKQCGI